MVFLTRVIFFSFFLFGIIQLAHARTVSFVCITGLDCNQFQVFKEKLQDSNAVALPEIRSIFNQLVPLGKFINISVNEQQKDLTIVFEGFKKIKDIRLTTDFNFETEKFLNELKIQKNIAYSEEQVSKIQSAVRELIQGKIKGEFNLTTKVIFEGDDVVVDCILSTNNKLKLKQVKILGTPWVIKHYTAYFNVFLGGEFDPLAVKLKSDQIAKELFSAGYFKSKVTVLNDEIIEGKNNEKMIVSNIQIDLSPRYNFSTQGNTIFSMQEIRARILDHVKVDLGEFNQQSIKELINELYESSGVYDTQTRFRIYQSKDLNGDFIFNIYIDISEGKKIPVSGVNYKGVNSLSTDELEALFNAEGSALAKNKFYDRKFFEEYTDILKKKYYTKGFVQAEVSRPLVTKQSDQSVVIEYLINERESYKIGAIQISNIPKNLEDKIKLNIKNKEKAELNIVDLEDDLRKMISVLQEEGYYFANIINLKDPTLLQYDKTNQEVNLGPKVELGNQICFNELIVAGNRVTRNKVIEREVHFQKGEIITPSSLEELNQRLGNLGLFASLRITPYVIYEQQELSCSKTNILVQVKEKDFGLAEIAPGYRTDLGWKLSTGVTYNNLQGMNRQFGINAQSNLRTSLKGFDAKRRQENKDLVEYTLKTNVIEPYAFHNLLKTQLEFELSATAQRRRLYNLDADIYKISPQFSKSFGKHVSTALKYQFERIVQFDATEAINNDNFFIGSLTPSLTLDFRDDPINTRKGAYFNLSSEWANRYFLSINNKDLEINYLKITNRNRFYIPMGPAVLAISLSGGYQKNFANDLYVNSSGQTEINSNGVSRTRGYIPSIKLFRLEGYDEVRGFDDSEINVVESGRNIGQVVLQDSLYFVNFKLEPRYNVTDQVQLGVFFDAGRLYQDHLKPLKLRSAMGAGLKFLTPVGSLDFDYGIKLDRKIRNGAQESFGKFHLSIGFF